ncbi:MAG: hypothetical protein H6741_28615 [Alphaproteobacteria bacterium]|nr:hypothetical protein [Alphaproteobacteria bacterium]
MSRPPNLTRREALAAALLGLAAMSSTQSPARAEDPAPASEEATALVLVLHPGVPTEELKRSVVSAIYKGRRMDWERGKLASPFLRPMDSPMTEAMLDQVIGGKRAAYESGWQSIELSGQGMRPKELVTIEEVIETVKSTEGAVCYAFKGELIGDPPEGVVILPAPSKGGE